MKAQFKDNFTSRDGSTVAVEVSYKQGITGAMNERKALERAAEMIGRKLEELEAAE